MTLEKDTQDNVIQVLKNMGYEYIGSHINLFGHSPKLDDNFKKQIERLNKDTLENKALTPTEFERLRNEYPKNPAEAFEKLRNGVQIVLDNNKKASLRYIDKVHPENNVFQVTQELIVKGLKENRLDLIILINGIPVSNIELKKAGTNDGTQKALTQINRYLNNGIYEQDLLNFLQFFVISNGVETRYFSVESRNDARYGEFAFTWMDENNKPINRLLDFVDSFFKPAYLVKILFNYMLMKPNPQNQIVIMRPYQIHGSTATIDTVHKGLGIHTYISASTGSGKTLTSFKTAELLASEGRKVIMLLDRNDLAEQTTREFKTFDTTGLIKDIVKKEKLGKAVTNVNERMVITTIQSFSIWCRRNPKQAKELANPEDVVIIIDECHRSTSADMFAAIKKPFWDKKRNLLKCNLIGFTGTPLLEENSKAVDKTTQAIFGEASHIYTITEAIRDKSILPFKTFTINVNMQGVSDDDLKSRTKSEIFGNDKRILANASEIAKQFKSHTKQNDDVKSADTEGFMAMLATDNKNSASKYWEILHKLFALQNRKVAIIFSLEDNKEWKDSTVMEQDKYENILSMYDADFGTNFQKNFVDDMQDARHKHMTDIVDRSKKGEIDLLIVSDMFLTGYDNKFLNTIYLDKNLKQHSLLQAVSRTNRLCGDKKNFGNVVFFSDRDMESLLDDAIQLFGTAVNIEEIIDKTSYKDMLGILRKSVFDLREVVGVPDDVVRIDSVEELRNVIKRYRAVVNALMNVRVYPEWDDVSGFAAVGVNRDDLELFFANIELVKKMLIVDDPDVEQAALEAEFIVSTVDGEIIGYRYIMKLLNNYVASPPAAKERWLRSVEEILRNSSDPEILLNKPAVERVLDAARRGEINTVDDLFERLRIEQDLEKEKIYRNFAVVHGLSWTVMSSLISDVLNGVSVTTANLMDTLTLHNEAVSFGSPKKLRDSSRTTAKEFNNLFTVVE